MNLRLCQIRNELYLTYLDLPSRPTYIGSWEAVKARLGEGYRVYISKTIDLRKEIEK